MRVLFVDDEPRILDGLRDLLRKQRHRWTMEFALGGEAALAALDRAPFDVVVTDMRMPRVDGARVLAHAQERHPQALRIVLSGQTEVDAALRAAHVAHQFLAKPCDVATLTGAIERASRLHGLIEDPRVRAVVGRLDRLPAAPRLYAALTARMQEADASAVDIARLLEQDMAMSLKLLKLVNSAFFGVVRPITTTREAVAWLGFESIKNLVLTVEVFRSAPGVDVPGFSVEGLQRHALEVAGVARKLLRDPRHAAEAFTAGLLHDIGALVWAMACPNELERVLAAASADPGARHTVEESVTGVSHAEVGVYLLGIWGLPCPIVEAVAHHHHPERVARQEFDVSAAVHVADRLMHEAARPTENPLTERDLQALGAQASIETWRGLAADLRRATYDV